LFAREGLDELDLRAANGATFERVSVNTPSIRSSRSKGTPSRVDAVLDNPGKANSGSSERSGICTVRRVRSTLGASDLSWMLLG
jgi:hypothetical protein